MRSFTLFIAGAWAFGSGQGETGKGRRAILPELNPKGSSADDVSVSPLPTEAWFAIGLIIGATVLCLLYSLADSVRVQTEVHDTKIKARNLRDAYAAQVAELQARQAINEQVSIVGQGPPVHAKAA